LPKKAQKKPFRSSISWIIIGVWIVSVVLVLVATRIHPAARVNISVNVKEISFRTDAKYIFDQFNEEQLIVSGLNSLRVDFSGGPSDSKDDASNHEAALDLQGGPGTSCSFYQVRSGRIELAEPSVVTLGAPNGSDGKAFNLKVHGSASTTLTSMPATAEFKPGFTCTNARVSDRPAGTLERSLSTLGLDTLLLVTAPDSRFDFVLAGSSKVENTQIPVLGEIRFSSIDPRSSEEKTILLPATERHKNEIAFEEPRNSMALDDADLLLVIPEKDFTLRRFSIDDGIHANFYGSVRDLKVGAAANDMVSRMPSYFDRLDAQKRFFGAVPALAALILGLLEKLGASRKNETTWVSAFHIGLTFNASVCSCASAAVEQSGNTEVGSGATDRTLAERRRNRRRRVRRAGSAEGILSHGVSRDRRSLQGFPQRPGTVDTPAVLQGRGTIRRVRFR
jgi:hypothetical protein